MLYKTRGASTPQGKPRVYFSCHPADHGRYFDLLCRDIHAAHNCSVWYRPEEGPPDAEELADLAQMQLFVVPVTRRLLSAPNRVVDVELPFAAERHIPVVPILVEPGLDKAFAAVFGDIQYLDRTARDPTVQPYEVKLEKCLNSLLLGDELASQVRAAFDAYIFLSYRKKDRAQAQELMRLIHQNDLCRDVAIWYDEYLNPSEDFTDAIGQALEKSDLFALVVTPNLLEEGNYVAVHEYPAAANADRPKPILPLEMLSTDRATLEERFPAIPPCVDARNGPDLSRSLAEQAKGLPLRQKNADPRHDYLIGLAYLGGIDMEVDHPRAVALLTGAARDGLPAAMEKLVEMYRAGQGVERDPSQAIRWQERLTEALGARYRQSGTLEDAEDYLRALWNLGDYRYERRDLKGAKNAFEEMRALSERLVSQEDAVRGQIRSTAYERLGTVARAEGMAATAWDCYEKGLHICLSWAERTGEAGQKVEASIFYDRLGNLRRDDGLLEGAMECYTQALKLREQALRQEDSRQTRWFLSVSYSKQGDVFLHSMQLKKAVRLYQKALDAVRVLRAEQDTAELQLATCSHLNNLGYAMLGQGKDKKAAAFFQEALDVGNALAEQRDAADVSHCLQISHEKLGDLLMETGAYPQAAEHYECSLALSQALAQISDAPEIRRDLAMSYDKTGGVYLAQGDIDGAEEAFQTAFELKLALYREAPTQENGKQLAVSHSSLGDLCRYKGEPEEARDHYLEAIDLLGRFNSLDNRVATAMMYSMLGLVNGPDGGWDRASLDRAMDIWAELLREQPLNPFIQSGRKMTRQMLRDCPEE